MCISSSSNQADEVYTNVYTKIVVFFEPSTNRTKVMLTYQGNGREKDYFLLPAVVFSEGLCPTRYARPPRFISLGFAGSPEEPHTSISTPRILSRSYPYQSRHTPKVCLTALLQYPSLVSQTKQQPKSNKLFFP